MLDYFSLKLIHIISAMVLLGTGLGSAFYMFMANRQKNLHEMYYAVRTVVIADWIFTTPAVFTQAITGYYLIEVGGHEITDRWIINAIIIAIFVLICWMPVVWIQIKMRNILQDSIEQAKIISPAYWVLDKIWITLGALAFPATILIVYLMVFQENIF